MDTQKTHRLTFHPYLNTAVLAGASKRDSVSILVIFAVERVESTVHNWVHKADLQPEADRCPDHIAVEEVVIQLNDEQYWLYAAADPETNESLHTKIEPTITKVLAHSVLTGLSEKHDASDDTFLFDESHSLQDACQCHGLDFRHEKHGDRNAAERVFGDTKRRTICF
jgi:transposase-like protein